MRRGASCNWSSSGSSKKQGAELYSGNTSLSMTTSDSRLPPSSLEQQGDSSHSRESVQSQSSSLSSYLSFASPCQLPGIQGASGTCVKHIRAHEGHICALTACGGLLYSASSGDNVIHVWRANDLSEVERFGTGDGAVKFLLPVGSNELLTAHQDRRIRLWRRTSSSKHTLVATLPTRKNLLTTFIRSSTGSCVRVRRHKKIPWIQHADVISALAMSPGKEVLYSASWDKTFKVWRMSDLKCLESVEAHSDAVSSLVVSTSGYVYTGSADSKIKVWERTATGTGTGPNRHLLVATLQGHQSAVNSLALSQAFCSDELLLYSGSSDRRILFWEREESAGHMSLVGALRGHRQAVLSLVVVDDILCSGSADKTVRVWRRGLSNVHTCLASLEGHLAPVKAVSVCRQSSDSGVGNPTNRRYLVHSGSLDSSIRAWLVSTT